MKRLLTLFVVALMLWVPACTDGGSSPAAIEDATDELYTCGMHPNVVEHGPGACPICGMDLVRLHKSASSGVQIDPVVVQNMGVRTEVLKRQTVFRHLRTIGEVEVSEDQLAVVNLKYSGWVEKLYVERTGDPVTKGQVLFDIYSPDLVAAQEEYLLAVRTQGVDSPIAQSSRRKLDLWDMPGTAIDAIAKSGAVQRTVPIRSPQSGFVLRKSLIEGTRVAAGTDVFRIGNLTKVWVTAEIYEHDAPWVEVGQHAQMEPSHQGGEVLDGRVAYIYPTLNSKSRTLSVRLEFNNPGIRLKPGMFATVLIEYRRLDDVIAVPTEAIMHTGKRQLVFVSTGAGHFEPHPVTTGLVGDRHMTQVLTGVAEGDEVVVSGQFLIDSESQLQEALRKMLAVDGEQRPRPTESEHILFSCPMHPAVLADSEDRCPKCGMDLEERGGTPEEFAKVYGALTAQPGQFTCPMHPEVVSDDPGMCPDCGMFLDEVPE